ncbi:uncharacterized protein LOC126746578 [Anthonomus grandis grandis]|uniref:uncharacterized protein LOC126746578 n=1 Tax=Anthonomus grandis grandis TaxID=2921223 RepID=UPI002165FE97|nr:uncharacterized protein LOC126746578 [Anthonomus grandis grandis]
MKTQYETHLIEKDLARAEKNSYKERYRSRSCSPRRDDRAETDQSNLARVLKKINRRLDDLERRNKGYRRSPSSSESGETSEAWSECSAHHLASPPASQREPSVVREVSAPLEKDILNILGEDDNTEKSFSDPIQPELASRWIKILHSGLSEEAKKELVKKYLPPENCSELNPPKMNIEVIKAVPENTIRRDTRLSNLQGQVGAATSAVAWLITDMLKQGEGVNIKYVECLNDIGRLLSDVHYSESVSRRELLALNINKDLKDTLT